jgi:membrane protease YdiL (CAAX protease family)
MPGMDSSRSSPPRGLRFSALAAAVVLGAGPVLGLPWSALLGGSLLPVVATAHLRSDVAVRNAALVASLVALTLLLPKGGWGWPAPALILLLVAAIPSLRGAGGPAAWLQLGTLGAREIALAGAIALFSGGALAAWFVAARPELADLTHGLRGVPLAVVIGGGTIWAALNAFGEESIYRGALGAGLDAAFGPRAALGLQALSFGAAHWHGVPRGPAGVVLAAVYGLMLGLLRGRARGLLAPMLAHLVADLVVLTILVAST